MGICPYAYEIINSSGNRQAAKERWQTWKFFSMTLLESIPIAQPSQNQWDQEYKKSPKYPPPIFFKQVQLVKHLPSLLIIKSTHDDKYKIYHKAFWTITNVQLKIKQKIGMIFMKHGVHPWYKMCPDSSSKTFWCYSVKSLYWPIVMFPSKYKETALNTDDLSF